MFSVSFTSFRSGNTSNIWQADLQLKNEIYMILVTFFWSHNLKILLKTGKKHDFCRNVQQNMAELILIIHLSNYPFRNGYFLSANFMLLSDRKNPLQMKPLNVTMYLLIFLKSWKPEWIFIRTDFQKKVQWKSWFIQKKINTN